MQHQWLGGSQVRRVGPAAALWILGNKPLVQFWCQLK